MAAASLKTTLPRLDWERDLHLFRFGGQKFALDVNSGALHRLDDPAWDALTTLAGCGGDARRAWVELLPRWGGIVLGELWRELEAKQAEGSLFTPPADLAAYEPPQPLLQALCLHVSHDCNLRCRYCFAGTGPFGGSRGLMPIEVGRAALEYLFQAAGPRPKVEVDFFGGEPLLNFPVVAALLRYGRELASECGKEIRYTLTTNGVGLTPAIEAELNAWNVSVILSLDGRPQVNDLNRPFPGGRGSYAFVLPHLTRCAAGYRDGDYWVRGTYTRQNLDFVPDVLHLAGLGFKNISLEPVIAGPEEDYAIRPEDLPLLKDAYGRLAAAYPEAQEQGQPFRFFHFNLDLEGGPCLAKRLSGCGAGVSYLAVDPDGRLFPCHQFVGRPEYCLGDVREGVRAGEVRQRFRAAHAGNKEDCRRCWARYYCSGGCHAAAVAASGDLLRPDAVACAVQRMRLEAALYLQAKI